MPHLNILNNEGKKDILKILCMGTSILMLFKIILDHKHMAQFSILALQKSYCFGLKSLAFLFRAVLPFNLQFVFLYGKNYIWLLSPESRIEIFLRGEAIEVGGRESWRAEPSCCWGKVNVSSCCSWEWQLLPQSCIFCNSCSSRG